MQQDFLSLSELNGLIREVFEMNFLEDVWLVAEIAELRVAGQGHCYLELVEKKGTKIVARIRANIWSFQYQRISSNFFAATGTTLQKGMKVLFSVGVSFHELYGVSLVVKNIDPNYSLGDLERRKKEILDQLRKENLLDLNQQKPLELVPKNIAVISSETAAGYGDFKNQIEANSNSYLVAIQLFPAVMQGDNLGASITTALNSIDISHFDCVIILRGGGASLDLAGFDNFELAKVIANFPKPIITAIGHERDDTVIDHVSFLKVKTPTAAAEYILAKFSDFEEFYEGLREGLIYFTKERVSRSNVELQTLSHGLQTGTQKRIERERLVLSKSKNELPHKAKLFLKAKNQSLSNFGNQTTQLTKVVFNKELRRLDFFKNQLEFKSKRNIQKLQNTLSIHQNTLKLLDPVNVLKRGYALVYKDNKIQTSSRDIEKGSEIQIKMKDGKLSSKVIKNGK